MPPPLAGSSGGCPAVWSISHHKGYCSRLSTVRPPHPCGLSCGATLLGRRPPPGLCTGSPVTGCFHGSGSRLPWSPMQPGWARTSGFGVPLLPLARWSGWFAPVLPTHGVLVLSCPSAALGVCGVLGQLALVHRCARWVCCVACAVSGATWPLSTGAPARCVALFVRCPRPLGSCSPVCLLRLLFCLCGVPGHLAPVHRCARSLCCLVSAVSWAIWLLFTSVSGRGVPSLCCPGCMCVCGVLAHVVPVHRCARCVRCACDVGGCVALPPPLIFFSDFSSLSCLLFLFSFFKWKKKRGGRVHCRHRHGQLVQWCNSVVLSGVCRRCFGGGRAPGVRPARPGVHGYGSGRVCLGASLLLLLAG